MYMLVVENTHTHTHYFSSKVVCMHNVQWWWNVASFLKRKRLKSTEEVEDDQSVTTQILCWCYFLFSKCCNA